MMLQFISLEISLIKIKNNTGPNTVPCGTPLITELQWLLPPGSLTIMAIILWVNACEFITKVHLS